MGPTRERVRRWREGCRGVGWGDEGERRGNEEAGPYRRLTAHPRLTSVTHVGPLFPTSVGFSLRSSPPYVGCEGTEPPAGGWGYEARSRREGKRNVGPVSAVHLSNRVSCPTSLTVPLTVSSHSTPFGHSLPRDEVRSGSKVDRQRHRDDRRE